MFNKILIVCGFGIVVLGIGIFYFLTQPTGPQGIPAETKALLEKIYAYSGTLTLEEQRQFAEFPSMLEAIDSRHPLPKSELTRLEAHFRAVYKDNQELMAARHLHGHGSVSGTSKRAIGIRRLISKIEEMAYPAESKTTMVRQLEKLYAAANDEPLQQKLNKLLLESLNADPENFVGLDYDANTGRVLRLYRDTVYLYKTCTYKPDGNVRVEVTGSLSSLDEELQASFDEYFEKLQTHHLNSDAPLSPPSNLRIIEIYTDTLPENPILKAIEAGVDELPEDARQGKLYVVDDQGQEREYEPEMSAPATIREETGVANNDTPASTTEITQFLEQLTNEELERLLERSDEALETELERYFTLEEAAPAERYFEEGFKSSLQERFPPERFKRAMEVLAHYGPEEGLRRLREIDPAFAREVEQLRRKQRGN